MALRKNELKYRKIIKFSFLFFLVATIFIFFLLRYLNYISGEYVLNLINENKRFALYILFGMYLVSPALLLPTFYLTLFAGMLWGPFWGVIIHLSGATIGSTMAFMISRYIAGDFVKQRFSDKFQHFLNIGTNKGWKLNAFLRLNPIFPSAMIGYFFGLTSIRPMEFIVSTFVFLIPSCITIVLLGGSFVGVFFDHNLKGIMLKVVILMFSLTGWFVIGKLFKNMKCR